VAEYGGATAVGVDVAGGSAETDCAYALAATPTNNPKPSTVDFNKLGMRALQCLKSEAYNGPINLTILMIIVHRTHACGSFSCHATIASRRLDRRPAKRVGPKSVYRIPANRRLADYASLIHLARYPADNGEKYSGNISFGHRNLGFLKTAVAK
jgi:hypothetical protein